jgi:hypothetical protein
MSDAVFIFGEPMPIDRTYFRQRYGQNFPDLLPDAQNALLDILIKDVYTMFTGIGKLWDMQSEQVWYDKTRMCYGLLLAWYIVDTQPELAVGIPSMSGMPLKQKSIGGVKIVFGNPDTDGVSGLKNYKDQLAMLKTNPFGYKAYSMLNGAVQMSKLRGRRRDHV